MNEWINDKGVYRTAPATPGLFIIYMVGISQDVKKTKNLEFLPYILWVFVTIYIFVALRKITMRFKQLEASHIMSLDSLY